MIKLDKSLFIAGRQTIRLATPIVGARIVVMINNFIAMLLIAQLGHAQLAAGALVTSIYIMLMVTGMALLYAVGIITSHLFGAKKNSEIGNTFRSGLILATLVTIPIIIIMWNITPILRLFGQQEILITLTQQYFHGLAFGILPLMLNVSCSQFVVAVNRPRIILIINALRPIFMLLPGYALLFGKFGLPKIGMAGMAYASAFMSWMILILLIIYLLWQPQFKSYKLFAFTKKSNFHYIKQLFQIGWPISVQFGAELACFVAYTIFMGWIGMQALAAAQIIMQLNMMPL